jgi:dienelactone hydrolase
MKNRRGFLKTSGMAGLGLSLLWPTSCDSNSKNTVDQIMKNTDNKKNLIGPYGQWAVSLIEKQLPKLSFRRDEFKNIDEWRTLARNKVIERMSIPDIGGLPKVEVKRKFEYDGLAIEEISWQLPYGRPSEAFILKPAKATGKLPAILAFHDHGGNKFFGKQKITRTSDSQHPMMKSWQRDYYGNHAWANEIAKRGYVVMVSDAFDFESRRVMLSDVQDFAYKGVKAKDDDRQSNIDAYNEWTGEHEHILAKSLFCAGTTWPGVFFNEDRKALDILCSREDVDVSRLGCGGLSGGGLRTAYMGGLDERIKCAVCVGFMTTWKDFILNRSIYHTWMTYIPLLSNELDFPEILGLRAPLPTLVLNDMEDEIYTLPEMQRADKILSEVFAKANATDHYRCSFHPGPHKFDSKMQAEAFDWFDQWLK